jgi:hypothetical protein
VLVLVGAEFGPREGHLLGLGIDHAVPSFERPARDVIAEIHAQGGFAVVPHPFSHGGWHDWGADFDGLEVQNTASDFARQGGPLLPLRVLRFAFDRPGALAGLWRRPTQELAKWDELLQSGPRVLASPAPTPTGTPSSSAGSSIPTRSSFAARACSAPTPRSSRVRSGRCCAAAPVRSASRSTSPVPPRPRRSSSRRDASSFSSTGSTRVELRNPHFDPPLAPAPDSWALLDSNQVCNATLRFDPLSSAVRRATRAERRRYSARACWVSGGQDQTGPVGAECAFASLLRWLAERARVVRLPFPLARAMIAALRTMGRSSPIASPVS